MGCLAMNVFLAGLIPPTKTPCHYYLAQSAATDLEAPLFVLVGRTPVAGAQPEGHIPRYSTKGSIAEYTDDRRHARLARLPGRPQHLI